jgi:hypothetical protein
MAARRWNTEQKAKQSALIHNWQPWQHSTGAKTAEGKVSSSMNAHRGYFRRRVRLGKWLLRTKYNTSVLTSALITEAIVRSDKFGIQLPKSMSHEQFFNAMANDNAEAAITSLILPCTKLNELCLVPVQK